jgi:plastocyanin
MMKDTTFLFPGAKELMMKKALIITFSLNIAIFCMVGHLFAAEEKTEALTITNKIVVVKTFEQPDPVTLFGQPGTTVIWVNHSKFPVEVLFTEKKVVLACGSPMNFFVGKEGSYESNKIPSGGTASLCFTEKGRYVYKTKPSKNFPLGKKGKEHSGTIWIK